MRLLSFLLGVLISLSVNAQHFYLFVGTYTSGKSKGIYVYDFNAKSGEVTPVSNTDSASNPSYISLSKDGKYLYAVNEVSRAQAGLVVSYAFDSKTGKLNFINQQSSGSENPCHLSLTSNGKWLTVANYTGGSYAVFPLKKDGSILPFAQHIVQQGGSINKERQEKAHVHSAFFSRDEKYLFTPDLGSDKIYVSQFNDLSAKPLSPAAKPFISVEPGSGPRHLEFNAAGNYFYVIEELTGTVEFYTFKNGVSTLKQRIIAHPETFKGQLGSADIHLSPDGKFLYASNRGEENTLAIFSVDPVTGMLTTVGYQSTLGNHPRNFMIDPTGNFLLVGNMKSDNIVIFKRDQKSGLLEKMPQEIFVPNPSCLKMLAK